MTIDILPEEVLLEIFHLYVNPTRTCDVEEWCTLVHVCRKWRNIVLESPVRLNLRIRCHPAKPVKEKLDIWPTLPIVVGQYKENWEPKWGVVNVTEALEQNNRVCQIGLRGAPTCQMEEFLAAMHKPFPVLTDLYLDSNRQTEPVDPDLFLGGSAPCLRSLQLVSIPSPGLPKLLSSATQLADLRLFNISRSGYISPEAMVSCVSALTRLEALILKFKSPESFPISKHRPTSPPTRSVLSALTQLQFNGINEYLEDLMVRIDAPLLDNLAISLPHQFIPDTSQLAQFISHTPKLKGYNEARVVFYSLGVYLKLGWFLGKGLEITYEVEDPQVSCVAQVFTSSLSQAFSATVEHLYIYGPNHAYQRGDIQVEDNYWLEILRPFTSVKSLYLSREVVPRIAPVLQELIRGGVTGVLPVLQTFFLEDLDLPEPVQEAIMSFVSGKQFSSHPVAISHWKKKWYD